MRPSTILVATFLVWLMAKGRLGDYWALATTDSVGGQTNTVSGGGASHAASPPGSTDTPWLQGGLMNILFGDLFK